MARRRAPDLLRDAQSGGRSDDPREKRIYRADTPWQYPQKNHGGIDGALPAALSRTGRGTAADAHMAAPDTDRRRSGRRDRDRHGIRKLARQIECAEIVRQCGAGRDSDWRPAGILPPMAEPARG